MIRKVLKSKIIINIKVVLNMSLHNQGIIPFFSQILVVALYG